MVMNNLKPVLNVVQIADEYNKVSLATQPMFISLCPVCKQPLFPYTKHNCTFNTKVIINSSFFDGFGFNKW